MQNRFRNQLLTLFVTLVAATMAVTIIAVLQATDRNIQSNLQQELEVGERVFQELITENRRQLVDRANILAEDFGFRRAVATNEQSTIQSVLANHGERIHADLMLLLSPTGEVLAATHDIDYAGSGLLTHIAESQRATSQLLIAEGQAFQVVLVPVKAPALIAWAGLGFVIDHRLAETFKGITGADISYWVRDPVSGDQLISTLPVTLLQQIDQTSLERFAQDLDHAGWRSRPMSLIPGPQATLVAMLSKSLEAARSAYAPLRTQMIAIAVIAVLAAALAILLVARNITRPINHLMGAAKRIASGDYQQNISLEQTNEFGVLASTLNDMQEAIFDRERRIKYQAQYDLLTNLPNRDHIATLVHEHLMGKPNPVEFALVVVSLRNIQQLKDAYGMSWSDALIQQVAARLVQCLRRGDMIARLSNDQFLLYCDDVTYAGLKPIADKLLSCMQDNFVCDSIEVKVDISLGFALSPEHGSRYDDLLRRAQIALSHALRDSKHHCIYVVGQDQHHLRQIKVTYNLQKAIANGSFELFYQPKFDLQAQRVTQVEALLRWRDEELGPMFPDEFIPLAEQSGYIVAISDWVLDSAIQRLAAWQTRGIDLAISVNLSAKDFLQDDLVDRITRRISSAGIDPAKLIIELTESATVLDTRRTVAYLQALKDYGLGLSMDDFGTGYSSLSQLKLLPLHELKIDKAFVLNLADSVDDQTIVKSTIEIAHNMGLTVVAEGVENPASVALLRALGCNAIQGYYLSKPLPASDLETWLSQPLPDDLIR